MAQYFDDFESYTVGNNPTGWTRRMAGVAWTTLVATVNSQKSCQWLNGGNSDGPSAVTSDAAGTITGQHEVLIQFRFPAISAGQIMSTGATYINTAGTTWIGPVLYQGAGDFRLVYWTGGSINSTVGSAYTGITFATNTDYFCRFGVGASNNWFCKVWDTSFANEPGGAGSGSTSAQITGTFSTLTTGLAGMTGVYYNGLQSFAMVGIGTAGSSAPSTGGGSDNPAGKRFGGIPNAAGNTRRGGMWRERASRLLVPAWPKPQTARSLLLLAA